VRIEVRNVTFRYDSEDVLRNVVMDIGQGVTGIVGPNGSGKTTLLKCLNGLLKPQKGSVTMDGRSMDGLSGSEIARMSAYVPQMGGRHLPRTVFETVLMGRKPYITWNPGSRDLEAVGRIIDLLGLSDICGRDINSLSGGQRQKVFIGRALAQEPKILLLDEPTANLDLRHEMEVMRIIRKQAAKGVTVVMSIHDLNLAGRYCDTIIMMRQGRIHDVGGPDVLNSRNIRDVYDVKARVLRRSNMTVIWPL